MPAAKHRRHIFTQQLADRDQDVEKLAANFALHTVQAAVDTAQPAGSDKALPGAAPEPKQAQSKQQSGATLTGCGQCSTASTPS